MIGEESTLNSILSSAQAEFLQHGYRGASLRSIVKNAGVTQVHFTAISQAKKPSLKHW